MAFERVQSFFRSDRLLFLASSVLFFLVFLIRAGSTSSISWISSFFVQYILLEYLFVFLGGLIFIYAWTNSIRLAIVLAIFGLIGYVVLTTGYGL